MEDRLVSLKAAIDAVHKNYDGILDFRSDGETVAQSFEDILTELPSAQPEIIRCKDCKYAEIADPTDNQDGYTCQFHRGSIWFSGSYCSWAERREE